MTKDYRHNTPSHFPLHPSQEGIYFEQLIKPESPAYNIGGYVKINGRLDVDLFEKALHLVIDGLDAFGLSFDCNGSISEQSVKPKEMRIKDLDITDLSSEKDPVKQALVELHQIFSEPLSLQSDRLYINKLFKVQHEEFWWVCKAHHIIVDGYGYAHFGRQVAKAYSCILYGEPLDWLADLPSYQVATLNALTYMESVQYHRDKAFWLKRYESLPDPLLDIHSSKRELSRVQHCEMTLPGELTQSIRNGCSDLNVSIQQLSLAALSIYYFKSTGAKRLCFGIPLLSRHNRQERQTVGMMTDIIPSLIDISDERQEVGEFIRSISAQQKQEYRHRRFPLIHLKRALDRATGTSGLFDVVVNYEPFDIDLEMGSLESNFHHYSAPEDSVPLQFRWCDYGDKGSLTLKVTYKPECFNQDEIDLQIERHFSILHYLSQNPSSTISTVPILSPDEQGLLQNWNGTQHDFPGETCIHQLVEAQAAQQPEATALVFNRESLSYSELNQRANQLAHYLLEQGVRPDTLVGLCAERGLEMMIGLLGILKAGGAYVPLDPSYPSDRLGHMIEDSGVGFIITQQHFIHDLPKGSAQASYRPIALDSPAVQQQLSDYTQENIDPALIGLTSKHLAYVIYTSGSTGKPKGVLVEHRGVINAVFDQVQRFEVIRTSRIGQIAALSFDTSVLDWSLALSTGAALYLYPHDVILSPAELSNRVAQDLLTHCILTPALLPHLESSLWESVQTLVVGGDQCSLEVAQAWSEKRRFFNAYGPTEATIDCCVFEYKGSPSVLPIGRPINNVEVYVLSPEQQLLPIGVPGELYIGGAGLARGYLNRPELTAETFIAHPFSDEPEARLYRTGDLVRWLPDGNLAFLGRLDHQVKIRGFRIELGEIESQLLREPSVKEAVVLAREDRVGDKRLVAYVTAAEALDVTEETLIDSLRQRLTAVLPDYMVPSAFVVLEHLPLTPNGKVDRKALPKPTYSDTSKDCVLPRTALETELSVLWSDVLGVERISIQANFFSLGGDSIKAIQVASRGQKQGLPLTTKQLFQHQTIAELVQHLDIHAESVQIPQSSVKGVQSLLPIQHHFLSTQPIEASKHFNQAIRFELPKDTQEAALRSLLTALLQRHDALRLSFIQTGSQWQGRYVEVDEAILQQTLVLFEHQGEPEAESHIQSIANQLHSSFDLAQAPLMRCLWVRNSVSGVQELIWVIHHLVVDGVSWRILLEDLQEVLQQHQSQENASIQLGSKTHSLQYWSERLEEYSATEACLSTLPYWQKTVQSPSINLLERSSIFMSTPGFERSTNTAELSTHTFTQADSQVEQICLSSTRTEQLLQGIHDCYHTQINDILLAALVLAVGEWAAVDSAMSKQGLCLDLEGHGREPLFEDVDLTQTLGWFTSVFPLHLPFSLVNDSENDHEQLVLEACIKEVKERLRAIPNKGMDYGILQRYQQARLPQKSSSQLVFNYLGVFEKGFAEDSGQALASNLLREHALGFNSYVVDGQWILYIDFHPQQFAAEDIKTLASSYKQALEKVLDHCLQASGGYTPSDFPLLSLTQKQVDHLQTESPFLEDLYPSTAMQQGLLFHSSLDPENGQYETQLKFKLTDLDSHRFKESWDQLVAEHAIFRTAFATVEGQNQIQVVNAQVNFPWYQYDWRHFSADQQQQQLQNLLVQGHCFTPEQAPLMNGHLAQIGEKEYWFVWQHHHALLDGWCLPIVFKELMARYQALATQSVPILPAARPYKDYIAWLGCQDQSTAEHYWRTYLEGFSEPTQVQIGDQQASGASCSQEYHLTLSRELTQQLEHQAQQHQVSLNLWLQLGWGLLLSHYSGTQDIVFGSTRSGRPSSLPGVEDMLGLFINSLPVRLKLSSKMQLQAALSQLKQAQTDQEDFSFTPLVDVQRWSDVPAGRELFDSLMVFENYPVDDVLAEELVQGSSNGCSNSPLNDDRLRISEYQGVESTHYPLTLSASPGDSLNLKLMYREPRFNGDQARQLLQHLEVLLHGLAHSKVDAPLASITLLSAEEKQQQLVEWNDTQQDFQGELCIHQLVEAQAAQQPEATALVFNRESLSYGALNQRANQLAHYLLEQGVRADTLVGLCAERGLEMMIGLLGILKAGGAYVPLDPSYPSDRLGHMIEDSGVVFIITQQHLIHDLPKGSAQASYRPIALDCPAVQQQLSDYTQENIDPALIGLTSKHLAYVIYTSGSTGKPKGVLVEHRGVINAVFDQVQRFEVIRTSRIGQIAALSFDTSVLDWSLALSTGAALYLYPHDVILSPAELSNRVAQDLLTHCILTPALLPHLESSLWESVQTLVVGGDQCSLEVAQAWSEKRRFFNAYGPTEATIDCCVFEYKGSPSVLPIGRPINNVEVYVLSPEQQLLPIGVPGELYIGGVGLARGYLNRPELTAETFIAHPFSDEPEARLYRTGDLVRWLPDGNLAFLGRLDHQVKIRGFRIELGEIESQLLREPSVKEAVVLAREDRGGDKRLVAYVTAAEALDVTEETLIDSLRQRLTAVLPDYMVPSAFVVLEHLPLTPNGKVDRKALPEPDLAQVTGAYEAPQSLTEARLAELWQTLLHLASPVSRDAHFFELGGHSLLGVRLLASIREQFGLDIPIKTLFAQPILSELAAAVDAEASMVGQSIQVPPMVARDPQLTALPLSYAQQRLWFIDRLEGGSVHYNMPGALRLSGKLDIAALEQSFQVLYRRHESLRTCFVEQTTGNTYQQVQPAPTGQCLPVVALQALSADEQTAALMAHRRELSAWSFDLTQDLMLQLRLLRLSSDESVLLLTLHHIAGDGWSISVLMQELQALYSAYVADTTPQLMPLSIQYADYALWQRGYLQGEVLAQQTQYWEHQLAGLPDVHALPLDYPRPAQQSFAGETLSSRIPSALSQQLQDYCTAEGATLFMGLHALFAALLSRYSNETDIVVGSPVANREQPEVAPLIGFFVNTLVLRADLSEMPSFNTLLTQCRVTALDAYAHQQVPFEQLVEVLQPNRHLSHHPLFQVMLALQNNETAELNLPDVEVQFEAADLTIAKFDLTLNVVQDADGLALDWEYNQALFKAETIARLARHFEDLLQVALTQPERPLAELDILSAAEKQQQLIEWNDTQHDFPDELCIHQLVEAQAAQQPEATALVFNRESLSYGELNQRANQLAHYLLEQGVRPDTLVGLCAERGLEMMIGLLGILKAGGAYVPLDPSYPSDRLGHMIEDSGAVFIITQQHLIHDLPKGSAQASYRPIALDCPAVQQQLSDYTQENIDPALIGLTSKHLAYVIYTSGSTGRPKGVLQTHRMLVNLMQRQQLSGALVEPYKSLQLTSFGFDVAAQEMFTALTTGGSLHLEQADLRLDIPGLYDFIHEQRIERLFVVPAVLSLLTDYITKNERALPHMKEVITAGEALILGTSLCEFFNRHTHCRLFNHYGPTETHVVTLCEVTDFHHVGSAASIGQLLGNTEGYVLSPEQQLLPIGVPGELYIGGVGLARGYLNRPELTAETFIAHPFSDEPEARLYRTGDLVRWLPDGNLAFLGRLDHQVKIRGFRIELGEIESQLLREPRVKEAVVLAREDRGGDKRLVAYVTAAEDVGATEDALIDSLKQRLTAVLPDYMVPSAFVMLERLPLTPNGKVDRKALPEPDLAQVTGAYEAPQSLTEARLAELWQTLLHLNSPVSRDAHFFELGGHSLLGVRLLASIREQFGLDIPIKTLFAQPILSELAAAVDAEASMVGQSIQVPPMVARDPQLTALPLSYAQQRLWFIDRLEGGSVHYNMPGALRLSGKLDIAALEQSFQVLYRRHESLRTCFVEQTTGNTYQQVQPAPTGQCLPVVALQALSADEQTAALMAHRRELSAWSFDLTQDLMLQLRLLRLSSDESVLLLTLHHIAGDGWSISVLMQELQALYSAYVADTTPQLMPLSIQYADYALWQRGYLQGEVLAQQTQYWEHQLAGLPDVHALPLDYPRPAQQSFAGETLSSRIPSALSQQLQDYCTAEGATLFMGLHALFAALLSRYSNETDIVVGSPAANREQPEVAPLIGFFVNTLVLRADLSEMPSFNTLLTQCRVTALDAYAHQQVPFEQLVEVLQPNRHLSHHPLFQVMLALQNNETAELNLPDVEVQFEAADLTIAKFDLTLNVVQDADGLALDWEYNQDLFKAETIARLARHFEDLLQAALTQPERPLAELDILSAAEKQQQLVEWNDTQHDFPDELCIHQLVEAQAAQQPEATALVFNRESLSYSELNQRANQLAHYLLEQGVRPDTLVGLCAERGLEMMIGLLGILKAGGAYVPLDPSYPSDRLGHMIEDSGVGFIITQQHFIHDLPKGSAQASYRPIALDSPAVQQQLSDYTQENIHPALIGLTSKHLAYVIYTSGSTGKPKGVLVEHRGVINAVFDQVQRFEVIRTSRIGQIAALSFDTSVLDWSLALSTGAALYLYPHDVILSPAELSNRVAQDLLTHCILTPALLPHLESSLWESVQTLVVGGDQCSLEVAQAWSEKRRFFNAYGPTEATIDCCVFEYKGSPSVLPIGRPINNVEVYVLSPEQQLLPIGVPGELYIGGAGLARGYLNRPELTAETFIAHPFSDEPEARLYRTGDLVRWLPDGNLAFLGRLDHQVKIRGFRIELGEIESQLLREPSVKEAVVLAREDRGGDKRLVAYVTAAEALDVTEETLIDSLRQRLTAVLPDYMVPSAFVVLEHLPLTPNGKVDRKALPEPDLAQVTGAYEAPQSLTEARLAELWQTLLHLVSPVSRDAHFFELGGHSLLGVRLLASIREQFGLDIPIKTLFAQPILSELAAAVDAEASMVGQSIQVPTMVARDPQLTALPLSYAQQRLWFIDRLEGGSVHYNMPGALRLSGKLDIAALEQSFQVLYRRHESLRTCFVEQTTGNTYQQVQPAPTGQCLPVVALQALSADEQTAALMAHRRELSAWSFDLTQDLMLQLRLLRLSSDESVLLLTLHHIAGDGWSISVLMQELQALYSAYVADTTPQLMPLSIQYADYALWQRGYLQGEVLAQQTQYWEHQLAGLPDVHALPLDYPRPAQQSFAGETLSSRIPSALSQQLQDYCTAEGATLFMGLHALFAALLSRYSNETDIVVGSPVANREQPEVAPLIGFFVNTLVLRADLSEMPSFNTLLTQCRVTALDAYAHQQVPFEQLVEVLQPNRHLSHHPLFQVMLALQNNETAELNLPDVEVQFEAADLTIAKFDLTLNVVQDADGLALDWEYNQALFKAETIARLARHFEDLLQAALTQPERPLAELDILSAAEKQQQLIEWNDTQHDFPDELCIHQLVEAQAAQQPEATALVFNRESLSYGELNQRANQLAHYLLEQGVRPDTLVGLCAERGLEMMIGLLGILKAGGAYVPLDPSYPSDRLGHMIEDSGAVFIITQQHLIHDLPKGSAQASYRPIALDCPAVQQQLSDYTQENIHPALIGLTSKHLAYVIYTSGSTGRPKGVLQTHRMLVNLMQRQQLSGALVEPYKSLQLTSFGFDVAAQEMFTALTTGGSLHLEQADLRLDIPGLYDFIHEQRIERLFVVPAVLSLLTDYITKNERALPHMKEVITAGEALILGASLCEFFNRHTHCRLFNHYGPTETHVVTLCEVTDFHHVGSAASIGQLLGNTEGYVLSPEQQLLPIGVPGELYIGGVGLARGYLNRPELTAETFIAHPFSDEPEARLYRTGDLVRWLPDGNLAFLGRLDHQVKIRGFRIELGEIESQLLREPRVKEAVVLAREDRGGDKRLVAYVTAAEDVGATEDALIDSLKQRLTAVLPDYMVPSAFVMLERLPLTPNGKVDRKALPEPDLAQVTGAYEAPQSLTEARLAELWQTLLHLNSPVSRDAHFFELGGHSLLAMKLVAAVNDTFSTHLLIKTIFSNSYLYQLAEQIDNNYSKENVWQPLVEMHSNDESIKNLPIIYAVPGAGGSSAAYQALAKALEPYAKVVVLEPKGIAGDQTPHKNWVEMLDEYTEEIQRYQTEGPYWLLGHSYGARVAFEITLRLEAQKKEVSCILLDAELCGVMMEDMPEDTSSTEEKVLSVMQEFLDVTVSPFGSLSQEQAKAELIQLMTKAGLISQESGARQLEAIFEIYNIQEKISFNYRASQSIDGSLTLLYSKESFSQESLIKVHESHGKLSQKGFSCYPVEGTHVSMLRQKHVHSIASSLRELIHANSGGAIMG